MEKVKITDIAKEFGLANKDVLAKAKELGFPLKTVQSSVSVEEAGQVAEYILSGVIPKEIQKKLDAKAKKEAEKREAEKKKQEKAKAEEEKKKQEETQKETQEATKETISTTQADDKTQKEKTGDTTPPKEVKKPALVQGLKKTTKSQEESTKEPIKVAPNDNKKEAVQTLKKPLAQQQAKIQAKMKDTTKEDTPSLKTEKKAPPVKKSAKKSPKLKTVISKKIEIGGGFNSDISLEEEGENVFLPDFNAREDILKKFEKAENTLENRNKNNPRRPIQRRNNYNRGFASLEQSSKKRRRKSDKDDKAEQIIVIPDSIRLYEFSEKINKSLPELSEELTSLGIDANKNDFLERDHMEILAETFDIAIEFSTKHIDELDYISAYDEDAKKDEALDKRAPVVAIMGHVDHGKTSLLDAIRETNITEGEAGGITQHIGAYMIKHHNDPITFLDTPGHAAFNQMRARGAKITDIIIIVVAADDGVKEQTIESIKHAKESQAPIIVAVNKIDKPQANIDLIKSQMAEQGLNPTDWGGDIDFVPLSAKSKEGIDLLLETILLQAELLECKANAKRAAKGVVIEASLEFGIGSNATIIVQNGTLKVGDSVIIDTIFGRIRSMTDENGKTLKKAVPGQPVKISGLDGLPTSGSTLITLDDYKEAKNLATKRAEYERQKELSKTTKVSLEDLTSMINEKKLSTLPIILRADFNGSLEAIKAQLEQLKNDEVKVNIIASGVGGITEKDIDLAGVTSECLIFGFNVRPTGAVKRKADQNGVSIYTYSIIYELLDEIKSLLSGLMSPIIRQENTGQADVKDVFMTPKKLAVAGCIVADGMVVRGGLARVIREGVVICDNSKISSLKRFKDDVKEVKKGYECGIIIDDYNDVQVGDVIETFIEKEEAQTL